MLPNKKKEHWKNRVVVPSPLNNFTGKCSNKCNCYNNNCPSTCQRYRKQHRYQQFEMDDHFMNIFIYYNFWVLVSETNFCCIHFFLKINVIFIFRCIQNMFCFNLNLDNNTSDSYGTRIYSLVSYDIREIRENAFIYTRQHHNEMPLTRVSK